MNEPRLDDEQLAALLEGRLDAQQRSELLARLASADEDYEVFAETAAVLHALEAERVPLSAGAEPAPEEEEKEEEGAMPSGGTREVIPLRPPRRARRRPAARWLALAAGLAGLALATWLWAQLRAPRLDDPARVVALLESRGAGLRGGWERFPWSGATRGEPCSTPQARAVCLGAHLVDLELAVRARDAAATRRLAAGTARLVEKVPGGTSAAAVYRAVERRAGEAPGQLAPLLAQGSGSVRDGVPKEWLEAGLWTEAARIAAADQDTVFFRAPESRAAPDRIEGLPGLRAEARTALEEVRAALPEEDRPPDWEVLQARLEDLQGELGA